MIPKPTKMPSLREQRASITAMFDLHSAADSPTAYYALYHDPVRSVLAVRPGEGFVGRFQTGIDLFRPLVSMRCWRPEPAANLLAEALTPGRPYLFFANLSQLALIGGSLTLTHERVLSIYALDPARFKPQINVLIMYKTAPDGTPRCEIVSGKGSVQAVAGVNWQSPGFAELFVQTEPEVRQRGWGRSVAAACTEKILQSGRIPIYLVEPDNEASIRLATGLGYVDTGARQILADAVYQGHPGRRL